MEKKPRFGSLTCLRGYQGDIANALFKDITTLLDTNEKLYALQTGSPVIENHVQGYVDDLTKRFGSLPEPKLKRETESAVIRRMKEEEKEEEKQQIFNEVSECCSFEELLKRELRREARRKKKNRISGSP
mmetsp:Transcript_15440/g.25229  ORF Transcript_15440/g.25229 Transcript_15440/m.25229 type:complete len:130 (+) Transcript_15440:614-1003(+)